MSTWTHDELAQFAVADDLHISPFRDDGKTYGTPTWIWSVVVDDALYVRAYNGVRSRWYQSAMQQQAGRVSIAGQTREVTFSPADEGLNEAIDNGYRTKYKGSRYLPAMIADGPRAATVKITPRDA